MFGLVRFVNPTVWFLVLSVNCFLLNSVNAGLMSVNAGQLIINLVHVKQSLV